eukprot:816477-Pleurochrysis_carterae.AAC.5
MSYTAGSAGQQDLTLPTIRSGATQLLPKAVGLITPEAATPPVAGAHHTGGRGTSSGASIGLPPPATETTAATREGARAASVHAPRPPIEWPITRTRLDSML